MAIYLKSIFSVFLLITISNKFYISALNVNKRNAAPDGNIDDLITSNNQLQINYDEYPMVVPKRAAMLLDRLMVALHHALEDDKDGIRKISDIYGNGKQQLEREKILEFIQANNPMLKNLAKEIEKGRYDVYNEAFNNLNVRDLKPNEDSNDLQRRTSDTDTTAGRNTGRVYWRCYFNAVSCF